MQSPYLSLDTKLNKIVNWVMEIDFLEYNTLTHIKHPSPQTPTWPGHLSGQCPGTGADVAGELPGPGEAGGHAGA